MAYSPISDTEIDPESPITASLMARLRDNPLAIQEGDPTAPRILTPAYANKSVTLEKLADNLHSRVGTTAKGCINLFGYKLNYINQLIVGPNSQAQFNWEVAFTTRVYFAIAQMDWWGQEVAHVRRDNPVYVLTRDLTSVTVFNANDSTPEARISVIGFGE